MISYHNGNQTTWAVITDGYWQVGEPILKLGMLFLCVCNLRVVLVVCCFLAAICVISIPERKYSTGPYRSTP